MGRGLEIAGGLDVVLGATLGGGVETIRLDVLGKARGYGTGSLGLVRGRTSRAIFGLDAGLGSVVGRTTTILLLLA